MSLVVFYFISFLSLEWGWGIGNWFSKNIHSPEFETLTKPQRIHFGWFPCQTLQDCYFGICQFQLENKHLGASQKQPIPYSSTHKSVWNYNEALAANGPGARFQEPVSRLISFRCLKGNWTRCLAVNNGMSLPIRPKSASVIGPMNGIYLHHKRNGKSSINFALQLQIYLPFETATPIAKSVYI